MQQHGNKYFASRQRPTHHPPALCVGQNSTFSEHGHVTYHIKGNHEWSNMVANMLPTVPFLYPWVGSKSKNSPYSEHGHVNPHPRPPRSSSSKGQHSTFSEHGRTALQIKENHESSNIEANILLADPRPRQPWGFIGQTSTFSEHGHVAYLL